MYIEGVGEVEVIRKRISRMYIHVGRGRHVFRDGSPHLQ